MLEKIKNKITENSGLVNMVINLAILYLLFTVASGIKDVKQTLSQVQQQTQATIQPQADEELLKKRIIELLLQNLEQPK